jgi:hypothetical protein
MRKLTLTLAAMAVMVSLFAAAAYAATIYGTNEPDKLLESNLQDEIFGRQGGDKIWANIFGPRYGDPADRDKAYGNRGPDYINTTDGDDRDYVDGGRGHDECWGDDEDVFVDCEEGNGATPF